MNKQHAALSVSNSSDRFARRVKRQCTVLTTCLLVGAAALGISGKAFAAYGTCQPYAIWEDGLRNFQVKCNPGGATVMLMFATSNDAQASRFQSLISSAILSGKYVRGDFVADATLCAGFTNCKKALSWSLSYVPNP